MAVCVSCQAEQSTGALVPGTPWLQTCGAVCIPEGTCLMVAPVGEQRQQGKIRSGAG